MNSPEPEDDSLVNFTASAEEAGQRIDRVLAVTLQNVGRKRSRELCDSGQVRINGRRVKKSTMVREADEITVAGQSWGLAQPAPDLNFQLIFEDKDFVISDKPAGIPSAALPGKEHDTWAGALLARYPEMAEVGYSPRDPGLLHRLDTQTSGLLVAARNKDAFTALQRELSGGRFEKHYLALVCSGSLPDEGKRESFLAPDPGDKRRVVEAASGHRATSFFKVQQRGGKYDIVEVRVSAAYRHQVRVHLAALGAPLIGDLLYGGLDVGMAPRHALHASYIAAKPAGFAPLSATSALAEDLATLVREDK